MKIKSDIIPMAITFIGIISLLAISVYFDSKQPEYAYVRVNKPCEVVNKLETCCGLLQDRFILTNSNRYKVNDGDNIVIGDSVCTYEWSDTANRSSRLAIKNKNIFIYTW